MTISEMHTQLNLRLQKVNSNAFDNFLPEERDEYINLAISRFIKSRMQPESNLLQEGFEQSQKRVDDLRTLVKKNESLTPQQVTSNAAVGKFFVDRADFPTDYNYLISIRSKISYASDGITFTLSSGSRQADGIEDTDYKTMVVQVVPVQSDDVYELLRDPFNTTKPYEPIADINDSGIDVYTDDRFLVDEIIINYLKKPATVSLSTPTDSDLPEHTHDEVVDMAAELMLSDIGALGTGNQIETLKKVE